MTAHAKPTITPERVQWFADYLSENPAWGVFHVQLDDGNFQADVGEWAQGQLPDVVEAAAWFDTLTPAQREELGRRAAETPPHPFRVEDVDDVPTVHIRNGKVT